MLTIKNVSRNLWDSSSRCDSNAYSEFLRLKFWISILYPFRYNSLNNSLSSSSLRFSRRSHPSEWNFLSLKRMTPNTVPLTFLRHRLSNTDYKTSSFLFLSLCLAIGFPMHAFFAVYLNSKIITRNVIQTLWEHRIVQCSRVCVSSSQRFHWGLDRQWASCRCPDKKDGRLSPSLHKVLPLRLDQLSTHSTFTSPLSIHQTRRLWQSRQDPLLKPQRPWLRAPTWTRKEFRCAGGHPSAPWLSLCTARR